MANSRGHSGNAVSCISLNPELSLVAHGTASGTIQLHKVHSNHSLSLLNSLTLRPSLRFSHSISGVKLNSNKSIVAVSNDGNLYIWNNISQLLFNTTIDSATHHAPIKLDVSSNSKSQNGNVDDTHELTCLSVVDNSAAIGCKDATVRVWDLEAGREKAVLRGHKSWVRAVSLGIMDSDVNSSSGLAHLVVSGGRDKTVRVWDVRAPLSEVIAVFQKHTSWVHGVALAPNGEIVSVCGDKIVRVWDLRNESEPRFELCGHELRVWGVSAGMRSGFPGKSESVVAASCSSDGTVRLWDLGMESSQEIERHGVLLDRHSDGVLCVDLAKNASACVFGCEDGTVKYKSLVSSQNTNHSEQRSIESNQVVQRNEYSTPENTSLQSSMRESQLMEAEQQIRNLRLELNARIEENKQQQITAERQQRQIMEELHRERKKTAELLNRIANLEEESKQLLLRAVNAEAMKSDNESNLLDSKNDSVLKQKLDFNSPSKSTGSNIPPVNGNNQSSLLDYLSEFPGEPSQSIIDGWTFPASFSEQKQQETQPAAAEKEWLSGRPIPADVFGIESDQASLQDESGSFRLTDSIMGRPSNETFMSASLKTPPIQSPKVSNNVNSLRTNGTRASESRIRAEALRRYPPTPPSTTRSTPYSRAGSTSSRYSMSERKMADSNASISDRFKNLSSRLQSLSQRADGLGTNHTSDKPE